MKPALTAAYLARDITARRTLFEVLIGLTSIAACTIALTVVVLFTDGFERFMDFSFERARPIIGSLLLSELSGGLISTDDRARLEELVRQGAGQLKLSWVASPEHLDFRGPGGRVPDKAPTVWCLPPWNQDEGSADWVMSVENGVKYVVGGPLVDNPHRMDFGVLVNTKFLADFFAYTEEELIPILEGRANELLPKTVKLGFPPVLGSPKPFEPGVVELPVQGVFDLRDQFFPHLVVSYDVAAAYFYQAKEHWEPSYTLQFVDGLGNPLVPPSRLEGFQHDEHYVNLPAVGILFELDTLEARRETPFRCAILSLANYREPKGRQELKQLLEAPASYYDAERDESLLPSTNSEGWTYAFARLVEQKGGPNVEPTNLRIDEFGERRWRVTERASTRAWLIEDRGSRTVITKCSPWSIYVPSATPTDALNQVAAVVEFYSLATYYTILLLSALISLALGMGYVHRKRKDIGILKTGGMEPHHLALMYATQTLLVVVVGFVLGFALSLGLADRLEALVRPFMQNLNHDFVTDARIIQPSLSGVCRTFSCVMLGAGLGALLPCWEAMTLNPIEDLRTGI